MSEDGRFTMDITSQADLSAIYNEWDKLLSYMDKSTRDKLTTNNPIAGLLSQGLPLQTLTDSGAAEALSVKVRKNLEKQIKSLTSPNITDYTSEVRQAQSSFITDRYNTPPTVSGTTAEWKAAYNAEQEYAKELKARAQVLMASPDTSVQEFKDLADNISVFRRELTNLTAAAAGQGRTGTAGKFTALDNATNTGSQFDLVTARQDILDRAKYIKRADDDYNRERAGYLKENADFDKQQIADAYAEDKARDEHLSDEKHDAYAQNASIDLQARITDKARAELESTISKEHIAGIKENTQLDKETSELKASAARETLRQSLAATSPSTAQSAGALPYLQSAIANGGSQEDLLKAANQYASSLSDNVNEANSALVKTQGSSQNVLGSMKGIYGAMVMSRGILYSLMGGQSAWMQLARQGSQAIYSSVYAYSLLDGQASKVTGTLVKHTQEYINNQKLLGSVAAAQQILTLEKEEDLVTTTAIGALENKIASDKGQVAIATLAKDAEEVVIKQKVLETDTANLLVLQETKVKQDGIVASATANLATEKLAQGATAGALKATTAGIASVVAPIMGIVAGAAAIGMFLAQAVQWVKQFQIASETSALKFRVLVNEARGLNNELQKAPTGTITSVEQLITYATAAKEINKDYLKLTASMDDAQKAGTAFWMAMEKGPGTTEAQLTKLDKQLEQIKAQEEGQVFRNQGYVMPPVSESSEKIQDWTILINAQKDAIVSGKNPLLDYMNALLSVRAATQTAIKTSGDWITANKASFYSVVEQRAALLDQVDETKHATEGFAELTDAVGGQAAMAAQMGSINAIQQLITRARTLGGAALDAIGPLEELLSVMQGISKTLNEPQTPQEIAAVLAEHYGGLTDTYTEYSLKHPEYKGLAKSVQAKAIAAETENIKGLEDLVNGVPSKEVADFIGGHTYQATPQDKSETNATYQKNRSDLAAARTRLDALLHPSAWEPEKPAKVEDMTMLDYTQSMYENYKTAWTSTGEKDAGLEKLMKSWRDKYTSALRKDIADQQKLVLQYGGDSQKGMVANVQLTSDTAQLQEILNLTTKIKNESATWFNIPGSIIKPTASIINQVYIDGKFVTQTATTSAATLQSIVKGAMADFERTHITGAGNMQQDKPGTT